ncbi:immunity protein YezG family protein [Edaphobacillus lindanitolerans]|uniref:DUF600 family protein n=1 Tax=Edaphobacillus lindanitolerans TaxID=550447 RepID=A0A1U7PRF4_9BACI|nr:immunity protein YezG family protein [Edaphobacillus lindanitolerans]SIT87183.1 conserved hypothetical protein [Edaphobacillus lindanitolerans]
MITNRANEIYQQIARSLDELIPEEWDKTLMYMEDWDDSSTVYFFYYPTTGASPVLSHDIPERFHIDEDDFEMKEYELIEVGRSLQKVFEEEGQEPWTSFTFILGKDGQFKIDYAYEDLSDVDPGEQREAWKAKYGID